MKINKNQPSLQMADTQNADPFERAAVVPPRPSLEPLAQSYRNILINDLTSHPITSFLK